MLMKVMANKNQTIANAAEAAAVATSNGTKTEITFAAAVASVKTIDSERGFINLIGVPAEINVDTERNYFGEYGMYCTAESLATAIRRSYPNVTYLESDYAIRRGCRYTFDNYAYLISDANITVKATCYPKGSKYTNADGETVTREKDRWYLNIVAVKFADNIAKAYEAKVIKLTDNMF